MRYRSTATFVLASVWATSIHAEVKRISIHSGPSDTGTGQIDRRDRRDTTKPFLLLVHHPAAHMPFQESDELKDRFRDTVCPINVVLFFSNK